MNKLIVFLTVLTLMGCAAMQKVPVEEVKQTIDTVTIVCNSAQMLDDAGLDVPGVDQCDKIVPQLTREEVGIILDILKCSQDNEPTSKGFGLCAGEEGWDPLKLTIKKYADELRGTE